MKCEVELGPDGCIRLHTPTGRTLDLAPVPAAIALLRRILYHAQVHEQKPMSYPTQAILDAWARGRAIDWSKPEPAILRQVVEPLPTKVRKKKPSAKAFKSERKAKMLGAVDLTKVEFTL